MTRNRRIYLLVLTTLCAASPALAQQRIPFTMTRDKKLLVKVEVEGKERALVFDTGAVDLVLDAAVVGLKPSDLREKSLWNLNTRLGIAERQVAFRFAGRKFSILAAIIDCGRLSETAGTKVEGIIGVIVFQQFKRVTIDFENSRIDLW